MSGLNVIEIEKHLFQESLRISKEFMDRLNILGLRPERGESTSKLFKNGTDLTLKSSLLSVARQEILPAFALCGNSVSPESVSSTLRLLLSKCWLNEPDGDTDKGNDEEEESVIFHILSRSIPWKVEEPPKHVLVLSKRILSGEFPFEDFLVSCFKRKITEHMPLVLASLRDHRATVSAVLSSSFHET